MELVPEKTHDVCKSSLSLERVGIRHSTDRPPTQTTPPLDGEEYNGESLTGVRNLFGEVVPWRMRLDEFATEGAGLLLGSHGLVVLR